MENTLDRLVELEWEMFQKVNEGGPRASCQDDWDTFRGMRRGQFAAWPEAVRLCYLRDLEQAAAAGRNLVEEKYIRMMEHTAPDRWAALQDRLAETSPRQRELAEAVTRAMVEQTEALFDRYPLVAGRGRPLRSGEDTAWDTSVETYQRSELLTYSEETLTGLWDHLQDLESRGLSLARQVLENSVAHYGFGGLDEAEARMAGR